jgi:hypothetical protein
MDISAAKRGKLSSYTNTPTTATDTPYSATAGVSPAGAGTAAALSAAGVMAMMLL